MARPLGMVLCRAAAPVAFVTFSGTRTTFADAHSLLDPAPSNDFTTHFHKYASIDLVDGKGMTPGDFLQSLMPPNKSVTVFSKKIEESFIELTDMDGDLNMDLEDYAVVNCLARISMKDLNTAFRMFDRGEDGTLNANDLGMMLRTLANNLIDPHARQKLSFGQVQDPAARAKVNALGMGMVNRINKRNGSQGDVTYAQFEEYTMAVRKWILEYLFEQYDREDTDLPDGEVHAKNFGEVMIVRFAPDHVKTELRKRLASEVPATTAPVHLDDCLQFGIFVRNIHNIERFFSKYMKDTQVSRSELKAVTKAVCGVELTSTMLDILYYVFDEDDSSTLCPNEFFGVLSQGSFVPVSPVELDDPTSTPGIIQCLLNCTRSEAE